MPENHVNFSGLHVDCPRCMSTHTDILAFLHLFQKHDGQTMIQVQVNDLKKIVPFRRYYPFSARGMNIHVLFTCSPHQHHFSYSFDTNVEQNKVFANCNITIQRLTERLGELYEINEQPSDAEVLNFITSYCSKQIARIYLQPLYK